MELELLTGQTLGMLVMDFALVFAVLLLVRVIYGVASGVDTMHEISVKDNFAVGVSLAGATAAIGIMLTGVVSGEFAFSYGMELAAMASYGALGLVLMWLTRLIFDRIALPHLSVRAEIGEGNIAVATVEAGNLLATAIMVRAVMIWSDDALLPGLIAVVVGYIASQIILTVTAYYRIWLYRLRNSGGRFSEAVQSGNLAVALRFIGFQIGVALAVTAAGGLAPYEPAGDPVMQALVWGLVSIGAAVVLVILTLVAEFAVLTGLDLSEEVDRQRNIGVALVEVAVYLAIGLLLLNHLA
jgi:uncharacterized membrane protein YjfL (UPF0719 family)